MPDNFNTYYENIEPEFWRDLCVNTGELLHFERGEDFVTVGQVAKYIGYIKCGIMKYVAYSDDGSEHVMGMEFDGGFIADFPFSFSGKKARLSIVASTPCEVYCVRVEEVTRRMKSDEAMRDIILQATEAVFSTVYDRYIDLYCLSPRQRYEDLITRSPDIFLHFSLRDIASYLKITPTHLSRIRKKQ